MPKIPGIPHLQAVRALEKAGFTIVREGKHIVISDGRRILTIPRHNPLNAYTMGGIAQDAGHRVQDGEYDDEVRRSFSQSRGRESTVLQMKYIWNF